LLHIRKPLWNLIFSFIYILLVILLSKLGEGFSPRRNINETILNLLELKNEEKILQKLYHGLLKEIAMIKKMM